VTAAEFVVVAVDDQGLPRALPIVASGPYCMSYQSRRSGSAANFRRLVTSDCHAERLRHRPRFRVRGRPMPKHYFRRYAIAQYS
jgi:hypothetical protein